MTGLKEVRWEFGETDCIDSRRIPHDRQADDDRGLHEKGPQRMLEHGNGTVRTLEGGLEMGEDLGSGPTRGLSGQRHGQLGRWAQPGQCRADLALPPVETLPDALPGSVAEMAAGDSAGNADAVGDNPLEEPPQGVGRQAEPPDFAGQPNAESATAPLACVAVAAKDASGTDGFSPGAGIIKAVQVAVMNQHADHLAVRTGDVLEPLSKRGPFPGAPAKPSLHAPPLPPRKITDSTGAEPCGVGGVR